MIIMSEDKGLQSRNLLELEVEALIKLMHHLLHMQEIASKIMYNIEFVVILHSFMENRMTNGGQQK